MKNFEKEARNQLVHHKSSLEVKPLWDKINLELRPQRKKPRIFWWPLGISLLGLSLFILLNPAVDKPKYESIASNLSSNKPTINSVENKQTQNANANSLITHKESKTKAVSNIVKENKPLNNIKNNSHHVSTIQRNSNTNKTILHETKHLQKNIINHKLNNATSSNTIAASLNSTTIPPDNEIALNKIDNSVAENKEDYTNLNMLDSRISLIQTSKNVESIASLRPLYKNYKVDKFSLYISIYGGYGYPIRSLAAKESINKTYQDSRIATETTLDVFQFGVLLGSKTYSGLFVESGFEYNRINERFDWKKTVIDTIGKKVITGYFLNGPGDTTFLNDSINILRISNYNKKIYNNYSFYSIPIIVGFEFNRMARTRFYVKAGILVNLRLDNKVAMLDETGLPNDYQNGPNTMFKSKVGFTPFVSAGVKYSFNNNLELFGELNYKHLNDIAENSYALKQSYNLLSANIGLQFNF